MELFASDFLNIPTKSKLNPMIKPIGNNKESASSIRHLTLITIKEIYKFLQ